MHGCRVEIIVQIEGSVWSSATAGLAKGLALRKWNGLERRTKDRDVLPVGVPCLHKLQSA